MGFHAKAKKKKKKNQRKKFRSKFETLRIEINETARRVRK